MKRKREHELAKPTGRVCLKGTMVTFRLSSYSVKNELSACIAYYLESSILDASVRTYTAKFLFQWQNRCDARPAAYTLKMS